MDSKPTLAFIDNSLHQKTASGDFLRELFQEHFNVTNFWDDSWLNDKFEIPVSKLNEFDYIFFEQTFPPLSLLPKITSKIIWAPMYDGFDLSWSFWKYIAGFPISLINFSKKLHDRAKDFGLKSIYVQYYLDPEKLKRELPSDGNRFYFWHRGPISWETVKKAIPSESVKGFILRTNPDKSYFPPDVGQNDIDSYRMKLVKEDYVAKEKYIELVSSSNIYIAPRPKEGIGISFIEALAMGHVVVANDDSTMNEYIAHRKDGYLFDVNNPLPIDFSNVETVRKNSALRAKQGFDKWQIEKKSLIAFINEPKETFRKNFTSSLYKLLHSIKTKNVVLRRAVSRQKTRLKNIIDAR